MSQYRSLHSCVLLMGVAAGSISSALAADLKAQMPVKAPPVSTDGWSGPYLGMHVGYAGGTSDWTATQPGIAAPALVGSVNFFQAYDFPKGTGSYFAGFQGGYNTMWPSRIVLGVQVFSPEVRWIGSYLNRSGSSAQALQIAS